MSSAVRSPRQRRTREQWERILDSGVSLLEDAGFDGFTIPALCERAEVAPRALYARADSKDVLFLAVYEHGMRRIIADQEPYDDQTLWADLNDHDRVVKAVDVLSAIFASHERFLRAVVLVSSAHPEIRRRGTEYRREVCGQFTSVLEGTGRSLAQREFAFSLVFSALVVHTAYGPGFGVADIDELRTAALRYLLD